MAGYKEFFDALRDKLATDTGAGNLVGLLGHTSSDNRISTEGQESPIKKPFLSFCLEDSRATVFDSYTGLQDSEIKFQISTAANQKAQCITIADRLDSILHNGLPTQTSQHLKFLDISNSIIANCATRWRSRQGPKYEKDTDIWKIEIVVEFSWHLKES